MISDDLRAEIIDLYANGYTIKFIAERYGYSRPTVSKIVRGLKHSPTRKEAQKERRDTFIDDSVREQYIRTIRDRTLLSYMDFTDVIGRRVKYIGSLPMNEISNNDLTTLGNILKQLSDVNFDFKQSDNILQSLQLYLERLSKV